MVMNDDDDDDVVDEDDYHHNDDDDDDDDSDFDDDDDDYYCNYCPSDIAIAWLCSCVKRKENTRERYLFIIAF